MKKLLSTVLIVCLALSAIACNNTKNEESTDTTDLTTRATETAYDPSIKEPDQTIDTMSPDQTTETAGSSAAQTGKYTYTVYAGTEYETTLSMDVNIDDYIVDKGKAVPFFRIGQLKKDLGWVNNGDPNFDSSTQLIIYSAYIYGDTQMVWCDGDVYQSTDNPSGYPQLCSFNYHLAPISNYDGNARSYEEVHSSHSNYGIIVQFSQHPDDICYYTTINNSSTGISREDAIIIAYVLSSAITRPGENPFVGTNLEKAQSMNSDYYLSYTLP